MKPVQVIEVRMWGVRVGAVALDPSLDCYVFAYDPAWRRKEIENGAPYDAAHRPS